MQSSKSWELVVRQTEFLQGQCVLFISLPQKPRFFVQQRISNLSSGGDENSSET